MRRLVSVALALIAPLPLLLPASAVGAGPPPASADARQGQRATASARLDGVLVRLRPGTRQVVTVRHTHGVAARVTLWRSQGSVWEPVRSTDHGRTGYGGLVPGARRHQGTGTTPLGTYRLLSAFGTHPHAARLLDYRRVRPGDFWVEDNTSRFYNRYRNQHQGGFHWRWPTDRENGSERLSDYPRQYEYSIVTSFNLGQVRHRGAGIFLHVNGAGATAGCVSAPRAFLRMLMWRLDPARQPVVAVGR